MIRYICFFPIACLLLFSLTGASQNLANANSLNSALHTLKDDSNKVLLLLDSAASREQNGAYDISLQYAREAQNISIKLNFKKGIAASGYYIGLNNYRFGNYFEAYNNYIEALKIAEAINDKNAIAKLYHFMGNIYLQQRNFHGALEYYFLSLNLFKELNDEKAIVGLYNNIGNIYSLQGRQDEALKSHYEALNLAQKAGYDLGVSYAYHNLGQVLYDLGRYDESLKNYFSSLEIKKLLGHKHGISNTSINIGFVYIKKRNFTEAEKYLRTGLLISQETGERELIKNGYEGLTKLDSATNNLAAAFGDYKNYIAYRDSLTNENETRKTIQTQLEFDFEKRESAAKADEVKKAALADAELQKQVIIRNAFIAGSILLLLLIVVLLNRNQIRKRMEIEQLRSRLSRDLHDDIGSTLSSINILSRTAQSNLQETHDEKTKASLEKINERSQRLLDNMKDIIWNINPDNDTIEEVMSRMREYATTILEAKNIDYIFNFPKEKMDCTLSMEVKNNMYLIFKEAVNNLSKYSSCTKAMILLTFDDKHIHLKIEDNGKGFNEDEIQHKGGLRNMKNRAEEINGSIKINSTIERGTQIELTMPRYC